MTDTAPLLLVVEDEPSMCKLLRASLSSRGYRLLEAFTAADGLGMAASRSPDLVLLDLGLPDLDGLEVTRRLRQWATIPIIVVSARGREEDKILALDAGANDYLTKPFGTGELAARIRSALKHSSVRNNGVIAEPILTAGALQLDLERRTVSVSGREVYLTPTEFKLFATLMKHAGRVLTHRQLLEEVWGEAYSHNTQYLRVYMVQLRHKLEVDPARPAPPHDRPGHRLPAEVGLTVANAAESAIEVAVFEEDQGFASALCAMLTTEGYRCRAYPSFVASEFDVQAVQLVVVDLGAPNLVRLEAIRHIRAFSEVPILVVTADHREQDKVAALDLGADDYLLKPIATGEFLARVRVALRRGRARGPVGSQVVLGDLRIDLEQRAVTLRAILLALTPTDYNLIALLARNVGRVVSHAQLLQAGWGPNAHDPHYLRVYIARLRRKLDPERSGSRFIVTEPGIGYRLSERASLTSAKPDPTGTRLSPK